MSKFWVSGKPIPQGSKRIVQPKGVKRPLLIDVKGKELKAWRQAVAYAARSGPWRKREPLDAAAYVYLEFHLSRPKSAKRERPSVKPDLDKLVRAALDAISGVCITDDARVVHVTASKVYEGHRGPGVEIEVRA